MKLKTRDALIVDILRVDKKHREEVMNRVKQFGEITRVQIVDEQLIISFNQTASYKLKQKIESTIEHLVNTEYRIDVLDDMIEGQILYRHEAHKKAKQYSESYPNEYVCVFEQPFQKPDRIQSIYLAGIEYKAVTP